MKVSNKTEQSRIYFPKNKHNSKCLYYKIVLHSELTNDEIIIKCVDEKELMDYYVFTLNLKDVRTGEYVYSIFPIYSYYSKLKIATTSSIKHVAISYFIICPNM